MKSALLCAPHSMLHCIALHFLTRGVSRGALLFLALSSCSFETRQLEQAFTACINQITGSASSSVISCMYDIIITASSQPSYW